MLKILFFEKIVFLKHGPSTWIIHMILPCDCRLIKVQGHHVLEAVKATKSLPPRYFLSLRNGPSRLISQWIFSQGFLKSRSYAIALPSFPFLFTLKQAVSAVKKLQCNATLFVFITIYWVSRKIYQENPQLAINDKKNTTELIRTNKRPLKFYF